MADQTPVGVIDGACGRKLNNALTMRFLEGGAAEPFATALQCAENGAGKKLGILFGFKNGSEGTHVLTFTDGGTLSVPVVSGSPSAVTRGDGSAVCTITRGVTTAITTPDGDLLLGLGPDPVEAKASSHYRIRVADGAGGHLATLDVIRQGGSYEEWGVLDALEAVDFVIGGFQSGPGGALALPFLGTRVVLFREPTPLEREALLAACVEIGIGVRPYVEVMGTRGAAWT